MVVLVAMTLAVGGYSGGKGSGASADRTRLRLPSPGPVVTEHPFFPPRTNCEMHVESCQPGELLTASTPRVFTGAAFVGRVPKFQTLRRKAGI